MSSDYPSHILLFDGVCNLCNSTVNFLIKRDKKQLFTFSSLQSKSGQEMLATFNLPQQEFRSFVYVKNGRFYQRSSAILHVLKDLGGLWKLTAVFLLLPAPVRDFFYNIIARNRYHWFGKRNECMIPTPELKKRFLD